MKLTKTELRTLIKEEIKQLNESNIEKFLDDLGKNGMAGWGSKRDNIVTLPKAHSKFDRKKADKIAKKHGLKLHEEDSNIVQYIDL